MDSLVLITISAACLVIYTCMTPHKRGFWTDDQSIQYPYRPLTVNLNTILAIAFVAPTAFIYFISFLELRNPFPQLKKYLFVILANILVNLYVKFAVGRLRPHFLGMFYIHIHCNFSVIFHSLIPVINQFYHHQQMCVVLPL